VFDELTYEENPKRHVGFGFNVDRSDVFVVNGVLRKKGYTFPDNDIELKRVKEELASQKSMFLLILKAMRNGQITNDVLDATEAALRRAGGDQVSLSSLTGNGTLALFLFLYVLLKVWLCLLRENLFDPVIWWLRRQ